MRAKSAYVNFDGGKALAAASKFNSPEKIDDKFLTKYCNESLEAIDRICKWLITYRNSLPRYFRKY